MANKDNEIPILLTVDSSALQDLENLASDVPSEISIDVSADTSNADVSDITDLDGETITPEIDTTESPEGKQVREGINFLATMKKIEIAINVVGTVLDFVKDIGSMVVSPFLDVEDAVAKINAQTGGTGIADLGQFVRDIQASDLGDSVGQISDVVIAATQLGAPIDEATRAALTFTHTFKDQDPVTVMTTLNTMAGQFGVSMQTASDVMTVAFQQGMNKGGDLLNVVNSNAQAWSDMGINETQAFSVMDSLMKGGVDNATDAAKAMLDLDNAATLAAANPNSPQADAFKAMNLDNPKEKGQAIGADFFNSFAASFATLPKDQQDLISGQLVGKVGKKFTGALGGMSSDESMFSNVTDAAALAAQTVDDSFRGAIDDFVLAVNTSIATLLSSDAIDLPGKIAALKQGFQDAVDVLSKGGTVGDALEVGLNIPGLSKTLDTFIGNFERIVGNIEIAFLQIVATIQDISGHGKEAQGTRDTIKGLASNQLSFDVKLGNADEVPAMINQALSRGLDVKTINDSLTTALNETLASGDFGQHINILDGMIKNNLAQGVDTSGKLSGEFVTQLSDQFSNAMAAGNVDLMQQMIAIPAHPELPGLDAAVADMKKQLADKFAPATGEANAVNPFTSVFGGAGTKNPFTFGGMNTSFTDAFPGTPAAGKSGAVGGGLLGSLTTDLDNAKAKVTDYDAALATAMSNSKTNTDAMSTSVSTSLGTTQTAMDATATSAQEMDTNIAAAMLTNTVTTSFEGVALSAGINFPIVLNWFHATEAGAAELDVIVSGRIGHLSGLLHDLQFLSAQVAQGVKDALAAGANLPGAGGGGGGGSTTVTTNVNQTNNNQNGAQTSVTPYQIAAAVNGGG